jgi:hypothetical protein
MPKGLSQPPDIVARGLDEPVADAPVKARPLLVRNLAHGSIPDQVVRKLEHTRGFDAHAAFDELTRRLPGARLTPTTELRRVRDRDRTRGDRKEGEQRHSVRAGTAEARGDQPICIDLRTIVPRERLEPKRESA